jgi:hypothetical protein
VYGYKKKIRDGVNASSPFSLDRIYQDDQKPASGSVSRRLVAWNGSSFVDIYTDSLAFDGHYGNLTNFGVAQFGHLVGISTSAEAEALAKVYDKIRNDAYGANGLLFLGELRETIHMLRNPLEAARKATTNYLDRLKSERSKARRLKQRKSETDAAIRRRQLTAVKDGMAGSWLELQFGWKPAVSDAKEICGAILDALNGEARRSRVRGKSPAVEKAETGTTVLQVATNLLVTTSRTTFTTANVQYVVGLKHSLDGPSALSSDMFRRLGFQFQNFVPTIYELIPYSFIIDYFSNLGDIVSAACTDTSGVFYVVRTERQETRVILNESFSSYDESWTNNTWHAQGIYGELHGHRNFRHLTITRTCPSSLPIPSLTLTVPGIDSTKWLNMAALVAGARDFRFRR